MVTTKVNGKEIGDVLLPGFRCRCGHEWFSRNHERPRVCPSCKSANWDKPYKFRRIQRSLFPRVKRVKQ